MYILILLSSPAFAQEVTRPRFLVNGEPIPYVINADGTMAEPLALAEGRVDALLAPIVNNGNHLLLLGGGLMSEKYNMYTDYFKGAYGSLFITGNLGEKFYYQSYQSAGLFGYTSVLSETSQLPWKYFQFSFAGYKWSPSFATDLGVMHISNFGNPVWIPLAQATISRHPFIIDFSLPLSVSLRAMVSEHFHVLVKGSFESSSYQIQNEVIQFSKPSLVSQAEINVMNWIWVKVGMEYEFKGNIRYQNSDAPLPETWKFYAGMEIRIR